MPRTANFILLGLFLAVSHQALPAAPVSWGNYPQRTLQNKQLKATLYLPDAKKGYYRGTRFDWSGLISRVECAGHAFFCEFKQQHDPLNHDDICGTAEEFGIESPPSFGEAGAGEPFIKIGVGIVERPDESPYSFWRPYRIRKAGTWKQSFGRDKATFRQSLDGPGNWDYEYTKTIILSEDEPELQIVRHLKNTGTHTIETDHYDHNFLRIDDMPAGTNYTLDFRFTPRFAPDSRTQDALELRERSLLFTRQLGADQAIWLRLLGHQIREDSVIKIVNHATGASVTISTDQPLSKLVVYSSGGVLCPEPFVKITVPPGESQEWTTTYRFEVSQ